MKQGIQLGIGALVAAVVLVGCGGMGHAVLPSKSPSAFASKAKAAGCDARSTGDGEYVTCDGKTYIAIPQDSGSFVGCDHTSSDSKCQEQVEALAK